MFLFKNDEIIDRLKTYPIFSHFSFLSLEKLLAESELIDMPPASILFEIHDPSEHIYYILDGYVELFPSKNCDHKIASVRSGNLLGETSILADEPHSFTARTNKKSQLLKIPKSVFLKFFEDDPEVLMQLTQFVAKRLRRMVMGLTTENYPFKNIVLYNTVPELSLESFKYYFKEPALQDKTHIYDKKSFLNSKLDILPFLFQTENTTGINIFFLEPDNSTWNQHILFHAEYIYLVVAEETWEQLPNEILNKENALFCDIVIWHKNPPPYKNTQEFYARYPFKRHHHFRDVANDYLRLYRYMTGQAIGLVIGAGGFKGYAHYGIIKAILESDIPIDCIGGCSFGAAIGAALAENFEWETFKNIYEQSIGQLKNKKRYKLPFTIPITSLLSGEIATTMLQNVYQDRYIEDIPINFFCVTANLSTREKEIKKSGKIWEWLRASLSLPGIFPPLEKEGNIYVDGAVCTSLPVLDMRQYLNDSGKVISLDVRSRELLKDRHKYSFPPILRFKDVLAYKLGLSKKKLSLPSIFDILLESSSIEQYQYDTQGLKKADLVITADTSSLSFSNPSIGDPQSLIAYTYAKEKLKEYSLTFKRWINSK